MAQITSVSTANMSTSSSSQYLRYTRTPWRSPGVVAIFVAATILLYHLTWNNYAKDSAPDTDSWHALLRSPVPSERCEDADDPEEWKEESQLQRKICTCLDPYVPQSRNDAAWKAFHVSQSKSAKKSPKDLDFVMYGDSITERWSGTAGYGTKFSYEENFQVWRDFFDKSKGAPLQGLPLGIAGDQSTHLLYHLQNGWLPDSLHPSAFVILIGTNDFGSPSSNCSKRHTLAGILHVTEYLTKKRPGTPIILHGLLPRYGPKGKLLGKYWDMVVWINRELKRIVNMHENWYYLDAASVFLERPTSSETDTQGSLRLREDLMPDGLHPGADGYKQWAPLVQKKVLSVINK